MPLPGVTRQRMKTLSIVWHVHNCLRNSDIPSEEQGVSAAHIRQQVGLFIAAHSDVGVADTDGDMVHARVEQAAVVKEGRLRRIEGSASERYVNYSPTRNLVWRLSLCGQKPEE